MLRYVHFFANISAPLTKLFCPPVLQHTAIKYPVVKYSGVVAGRGNFAVVGRQKAFFSGALIGPKSLFCFTVIACNFEICAAHRRSLLLQQAAQDAARTAVHESSGAVRSRKAQCQALPHSPETGDTHDSSSSREEAALCGEKIDNGAAPKKRIQAAQPPPPATRQQATQLLGETCTSMSASCCCCCRSVLLLL